MTNFDLEEIYEFLSYVRYDPLNQKNIVLLDKLLEVLNKTDEHSIDFREIFYSKEDKNYVRKTYMIIPAPRHKIVIKDNAVCFFFKCYFEEIRNLYLAKRCDQVFYLIDKLDNFPEKIVKNDLFLPIKELKKCLIPYWRKYDKSFLRDFICDNMCVSRS